MANAIASDLGTALRSLRTARGLRLDEASKSAGVSKGSLSAWENGTSRPRGPALERLLTAFDADARDKAHLLHLADPLHARIALANTPLGAPVNVGMVLRVIRTRRGLTQADLARQVGVSQAAVSQWEMGDGTPAAETLHEICFTLGATAEETIALTSASEGGHHPGLPDDPERAIDQIWNKPGPYSLREAVYLGWEAEIWRRAARDSSWDACLVTVLASRANWLSTEGRFEEIGDPAQRALQLANTAAGRERAVPAICALADADRHLGRGHAAAAELSERWAADLPDSRFKAWLIFQQGMCVARMWRPARAADLVTRSFEMDNESASADEVCEPWSYLTTALCVAYLAAGEPARASAAIGGRREKRFNPHIFARVEHANGRAVNGAELAYLRYWNSVHSFTAQGYRQHARIERKQVELAGHAVPIAPETTDLAAGDRLWAAVLRENRG